MSDRNDRYAEAFVSVVSAEGNVNEVRSELARVAQAIDGNDELRQALSDPHIPSDRRQQIVQDVLQGKASDITTGLVSMLVATGRAKDLSAVVARFNELTANQAQTAIAEVRAAVELTDDQRTRLASALATKLGHPVDVISVVDPTVIGGIVTQIGDTVIDGTVRNRLAQLKESF